MENRGDFKVEKMKNEKRYETNFGYYSDSIRTSGEVIGEFVRDKEVICKLVIFIDAKIQIFL